MLYLFNGLQQLIKRVPRTKDRLASAIQRNYSRTDRVIKRHA